MTTPLVTASKNEGVMILELSNAPANTYSYEMMRELDAHVLDARMDESIHVLMITGAGEKFFCAGADIKMLEGADPYFKYDGAL
ncbi:MAG: enoyl-CoA hydratase/isomerase family protein [Myxococcales bacterium]